MLQSLDGVPVGEEISDLLVCTASTGTLPPNARRCGSTGGTNDDPELGSIIVVVATDAPLMPHQLKRLATRVSLGIGRQGGFGGNGSGDVVAIHYAVNVATSSDVDLEYRLFGFRLAYQIGGPLGG